MKIILILAAATAGIFCWRNRDDLGGIAEVAMVVIAILVGIILIGATMSGGCNPITDASENF